VRVARLIAETIRNALDLLEEQPPDVIEAMLDGAKDAERTGGLPKHRAALQVVRWGNVSSAKLPPRATGKQHPDCLMTARQICQSSRSYATR
jgi:hypothetical protein